MELDEKDRNRLNIYLKELEEALKSIGAVERSEIILEISSHIRESCSKSGRPMNEVIGALGTPEQVANRFLMERGLKPIQLKRFGFLKWALAGVGVFIIVGFLSAIFLLKSLLPILDVNDEEGRIRILGGLIDIDEKEHKVSLGKGLIRIRDEDVSFEFEAIKFQGSYDLKDIGAIRVKSINGKMQFDQKASSELRYDCRLVNSKKEIDTSKLVEIEENVLTLDMTKDVGGMNCHFSLPPGLDLDVDLANGKLDFRELKQNLNARLTNGSINFERDPSKSYHVDADVAVGHRKLPKLNAEENFDYNVKLQVKNGKIRVD
ncbi:MAG: hypothetical protein COV44_09840 [Deltaproteobacteria bacterium CG11_big_fil_rev_8_21_14_0_20_45_16]|nr:MAG: hypothetical protein COV44_09840 [Deltaproteobacteria bacterium CG11_big_fil_rev_8_21_14_0_20_45_16]